MAEYPNGRIPLAELDPVPAAGGQLAWLLPGPAASLLRVQSECERRHGWVPLVTSAGDGFRSYERQVNVFRDRYSTRFATVMVGGRRVVDRREWDGAVYYRHSGAAAAVPGRSNHGKGITADLSGIGWFGTTRYAQVAELLTAEGWSNAEGRSVSEPWHWNYTRDAQPVSDTNAPPDVVITPVDPGDLPNPLTPTTEADPAMYRIRINDGQREGGRIILVDLYRHRFITLDPPANAALEKVGVPLRGVSTDEAIGIRTLVASLKDPANLNRVDFDL